MISTRLSVFLVALGRARLTALAQNLGVSVVAQQPVAVAGVLTERHTSAAHVTARAVTASRNHCDRTNTFPCPFASGQSAKLILSGNDDGSQ